MENIRNLVKCKHCGGDIAVPKDHLRVPNYHKACAWYELPCDICGKAMSIHRDWVTPPRAHKACKDAIKSKWYEKPCDYCGRPLRVQVNAVMIPKFHKKCSAKAQKVISILDSSSKQSLNVFLCHSSSDKPKIRELYQHLRAAGVTPWLDEKELLPGHDWHHEITKAIRNSHAVIVCLSRTAISKTGYVQKEIKHALDVADEQPEGTIFLIPLKLEECDTPDRLKRWQWVKLFEQGGYEKLMRALRARAHSIGLPKIIEAMQISSSPQDKKYSIGNVSSSYNNSDVRIRPHGKECPQCGSTMNLNHDDREYVCKNCTYAENE